MTHMITHPVRLPLDVYRDKVLACWLGKNIGGTLGGPFEGDKAVQDLAFYRPVPDRPLPNDDLDLQLVWLKMLEDLDGREPGLCDFADYWLRYLRHYPWDEYGICLMNLEAGLPPPACGAFRNGYVDNMGSPIRSEIWACLAPGDPQHAARLALRDATLDHAGGEGVWGEMFWAAVQSAAFFITDPHALIRIGLNMIPLSSQIARVVREAVALRQRGLTWAEARHKIATLFSNPGQRTREGPFATVTDGGYLHPCHAVANHGFTIVGWLWGEGFGDQLCKAANCGYDTDCTAATLASTLGIIGGTAAIPERWLRPIGRSIVLHRYTTPCDAPADVDALTERTVALAMRHAERRGAFAFGPADDRPLPALMAALGRSEVALAEARQLDPQSAVRRVGDGELWLHYHGAPVLPPREPRYVELRLVSAEGRPLRGSITARGAGCTAVERPPGWLVWTDAARECSLEVQVQRPGRPPQHVRFPWLAPSAAEWPVELNVPRCPRCTARLGACLCG
jgi:ADP-ribosylglycohydrolase